MNLNCVNNVQITYKWPYFLNDSSMKIQLISKILIYCHNYELLTTFKLNDE